MVKYRVQGLSHSTRCGLSQLGALRSFFAGPLPVGLGDTPQQKGVSWGPPPPEKTLKTTCLKIDFNDIVTLKISCKL